MIAPSVLVQENNLAVTALSYGYYEEAFRIMREATTKLNRMPPPAENYFCQQRRWSYPIQSSPVGPLCGAPEQENASMFRRAILLADQEDNVPVVASVVLFNLALCHHIMGTTFNVSKRIGVALRFYRMAYQIIEENRDFCVFGDLLLLAVINNIAESSAQLYEVKRAKKWFTFLSRILGVAATGGRILPALGEDDYVFFYVNAMLHQGDTLTVSPAA